MVGEERKALGADRAWIDEHRKRLAEAEARLLAR